MYHRLQLLRVELLRTLFKTAVVENRHENCHQGFSRKLSWSHIYSYQPMWLFAFSVQLQNEWEWRGSVAVPLGIYPEIKRNDFGHGGILYVKYVTGWHETLLKLVEKSQSCDLNTLYKLCKLIKGYSWKNCSKDNLLRWPILNWHWFFFLSFFFQLFIFKLALFLCWFEGILLWIPFWKVGDDTWKKKTLIEDQVFKFLTIVSFKWQVHSGNHTLLWVKFEPKSSSSHWSN